MVYENLGSRQELGDVEAGRAGYLVVPHGLDGLGRARDVDVAAQHLGEFSPGAHGHARGDAARAEVDERAIARRGRQCGRLIQKPAVDGPLPARGSRVGQLGMKRRRTPSKIVRDEAGAGIPISPSRRRIPADLRGLEA